MLTASYANWPTAMIKGEIEHFKGMKSTPVIEAEILHMQAELDNRTNKVTLTGATWTYKARNMSMATDFRMAAKVLAQQGYAPVYKGGVLTTTATPTQVQAAITQAMASF